VDDILGAAEARKVVLESLNMYQVRRRGAGGRSRLGGLRAAWGGWGSGRGAPAPLPGRPHPPTPGSPPPHPLPRRSTTCPASCAPTSDPPALGRTAAPAINRRSRRAGGPNQKARGVAGRALPRPSSAPPVRTSASSLV
jgi:hypothetical protein